MNVAWFLPFELISATWDTGNLDVKQQTTTYVRSCLVVVHVLYLASYSNMSYTTPRANEIKLKHEKQTCLRAQLENISLQILLALTPVDVYNLTCHGWLLLIASHEHEPWVHLDQRDQASSFLLVGLGRGVGLEVVFFFWSTVYIYIYNYIKLYIDK